jgi:hypothetical protein
VDASSDGFDPGQDEIDARKKLRAIVVLAQLCCHLMHEGGLRGSELRPPGGDRREQRGAISFGWEEASVGGILSGDAENIVHERGPGVELRFWGNAERLQAAADAFKYLQHRGPPGFTEQLRAGPGVRVDGIEHPEGNGPDRLSRLRSIGHSGHGAGDDRIGCRCKQLVLIGDVPVDRAAPRGEARCERAKGQGALAIGVEDLDRGLDNPLLRERVGPSFNSAGPGCHGNILT